MNKLFLFPSKFKFIEIFLLVSPIILNLLNIDAFQNHKSLLQAIICVGFYLLIYSKYPDDDEMLYATRLKATAYSLIAGILFLITKPFIDQFLGNNYSEAESAGDLLMTIFFFNTLIFFRERSKQKEHLPNEK